MSDFELDISEARQKVQAAREKQKAEAQVVNGDIVESDKDVVE